MNLALESNLSGSWKAPNTGSTVRIPGCTPFLAKADPKTTSGGRAWRDQEPNLQTIAGVGECTTTSGNNSLGFLRTIYMTGLCATGAIQLHYVVPTGSIGSPAYPLIQTAHIGEPIAAQLLSASTAADLIKEIRETSGLTLEMIAPLLGVSRRSIQSWKAGEPISIRKEERLRELAAAINEISRGNSRRTKDLLLERIPGVPRIYDLLAERRFDTAIARVNSAEKPKPIFSDQTIVFSHVPLDAQIAVVDDGPSESTGQLNRRVSRRLKR